jgi:hypothetical protein
VTPFQQLIFLFEFSSRLINITISGSSINIFTIPSYEVSGGKVYNEMLQNMYECIDFVDLVVLMGPSCSSLAVFDTQGFYIPSSPHGHQDVSKGWMYATIGLACIILICLIAVGILLVFFKKFNNSGEARPLLAN